MKKLMLLGGMRYLVPVIEAAHKLGVYVITCDYLPNNIAHKYSDEYCNVSILEKDKVLEKAKELKIDGILSFACDPGVVTAAYVAEKMGLPSSGPYESVEILQNKGKFRKFLTENNFNVPVAKQYTDIETALNDIEMFNWPVIVKPTDSAGSKGVTKVVKKSELRDAINYALKFSHSNEFIIEDFLEKIGDSSDCDSFSVDGELKFVSFSAQKFDENCENPYTPAAYTWPASISKEHQEELTNEIQRLLKLLDMKNSIYNIETRECTNGKAYIMECSPRGGGNRLAEMIRYMTGVDMITNIVKSALGMDLDVIEQKELKDNWAEIILHSEKEGTFEKLWISEEISSNIVENDLWIETGTHVGGFSGANEAIGTMVLKFDSEIQMNNVLNNQNNYIKVIVD
ncbi:MAG: ATP-grasp domain-containing protein [Clostridium sp.]|nr:ATP-grasp domain-containing protein [Clostridium sp.]